MSGAGATGVVNCLRNVSSFPASTYIDTTREIQSLLYKRLTRLCNVILYVLAQLGCATNEDLKIGSYVT